MCYEKSHLWQVWKNLLGHKMHLPVSYSARRYSKIKKAKCTIADIFLKGLKAKCVSEEIRVVFQNHFLIPIFLYVTDSQKTGDRLALMYIISTTLFTYTIYLNSQKVCFKSYLFWLVHITEHLNFPRGPFQTDKDGDSLVWEDMKWLLFFSFAVM